MTVARILANKGRSVVTTGPERTLQEVSVELMRHGFGALPKPHVGDCCVISSYGSVPCPPIQAASEHKESAASCCKKLVLLKNTSVA